MVALILQSISIFLPILLYGINFATILKCKSKYSSAVLDGMLGFVLLFDIVAIFIPSLIWQNKWYVYLVSIFFILFALGDEWYIRRKLYQTLYTAFEDHFNIKIDTHFYVAEDSVYALVDKQLVFISENKDTGEDEITFFKDSKLSKEKQKIYKALQNRNRFRLF